MRWIETCTRSSSRFRRASAILVVALLVLGGVPCAGARAGAEPDFRALRAAWAQALHAKSVHDSVALYEPKGVFVTPDGQRFSGRTAIRALYTNIVKTYTSDITFQSLSSYVSGDLAYDSGAFTESLTVVATRKFFWSRGSYLTIYRHTPSGWMIAEQVWTGPPLEAPR
jgi:ketosteroid isomerase-like protein